MQFVRKLVGRPGRLGSNVVQNTAQDDGLSLMHLRKLFMEFLHSPVPLTVREQEAKLYMMLPLFCKVFGQAKPCTMTDKFSDVCQFAAHVSRLMVNEIRRRAANQPNETASKLIMDFLMRDSAEDTVSGWNLLNTLNILAGGDTPVVECMVAASLPPNMVKCLYLFYDLPPLEKSKEKSAEDLHDDAMTVQKLYTQVLVKLCHCTATSRLLVQTDDLSLLFTAISCPCPEHNVQWRSCVSEILMTLTRHGLDRDVVHYIHSKSCFAQCLMNMRRIQQVNPLELVEMIVTLFCCLKDSSNISHYLLADFRSCHGYLFLSDLLLMLGEMAGNDAREACRNVVLLVSSLVMIGHVTLRPLKSTGAPFQDPDFQIPEPLGRGVSVRNIEAFQVLQTVFLKATDKLLCLNILDCVNNIYCSDNANYFILEPQHTLSLYVEKAPEKDPDVQQRIFDLLELVICNLNWVPFPELISVSILFKNKRVSECHKLALCFLIHVVSFDPKYKDVFREVGVLEVLTNCLKKYAVALKEKCDESVKKASSQVDVSSVEEVESLVPDLDTLSDYPFHLMGCLRLLLENNSTNATVFRECGGARCVHNIVPYSSSRTEALKIIRELILSGGNDDLGTLLGLMHSTLQSEVKLKTDVLDALLKVFDLDPRTRAVFREVGGFVYVMSVLIGMEGSLADPVPLTWNNVDREEILALLRIVFHVLTAAIQDDPANKNFMDEIRFRGLSDTIRLLGCFSQTAANFQACSLVEGVRKLLRLRSERRFSYQHMPLSAQPSSESIRSSVTCEEGSMEIDPSSVVFAANEMLKNLFDMATDSFSLKSGASLAMEFDGGVGARSSHGSLYIYHPGAITALVDLLPAVSEGNDTVMSEGCLELQLYWICQLQNLLKCEHNQQIMCEAGLPLQILDRSETALVTEEHPLHAPLQRMFERLASQSLTPTVLRDFLRLGSPLYCQSLEAPEETNDNTVKSDHEAGEEEHEENRKQSQETPNSGATFSGEKRKISEVTPRKVSDIVNRKISETNSEGKMVESCSSNLTFRDVMLSMIQTSSESSSDVESNSDEDEDYLIVQKAKPDSCLEHNEDDDRSDHEDSAPVPANCRRRSVERRLDPSSLTDVTTDLTHCQVTIETSGDRQDVVTSEVDGVDIDVFGDAAQEVSSIDQGEDMVILDVKGSEPKESNSREEHILESEPTETSVELLTEIIDDNLLSTGETHSGASSGTTTPHKAAEMSFDDISMKLSLELPRSPLDTSEESPGHRPASVVVEEDEEEVEEDNNLLKQGGGPVPLTRVKCVVAMTTPRDARAHGATDCPSFVEFDMSVDGFGCLFLPAISPQITPGIATVSSVMAPAAVMGGVPGVGIGERMFPPQAGLSFVSWICVDQYSSATDDPHPVRLLIISRQFRCGDGKFQNIPCLTVSISAKDKMLVVCTDEGGATDDVESVTTQAQREREHTEARFLSDQLLEEGRWHHVMIVLNKALIRNSTCALFVDGKHVATCRLKYIQAGVSSPDTAVPVSAPYISCYLGTPPNPSYRRCSRLLWRLGPAHLIEEPLSGSVAEDMYRLGPNYVGSFQAPCPEGELRVYGAEGVEPIVSEDKLMFGIHGHAKSLLTLAKIRKHFRKSDSRAVARELGLSTHDNTTPVRLIHNTAAHLQGPSRTIGAVIIGCSGVRTFCPNPVSKLMECIGGVSALLGLVAMATDVEGLYASVKALCCVLRSNPSVRRDMERTRGYQILALLLRLKKHLLNTHILHLTFALVGTVDSDRESSVIPNRVAFKDLLCDLEVWREAPADLQRSLFSHFLELLGPGSESVRNAELMQRLGLVPKLLFVLQDDTVTDAAAHTVASVLSVLLSNTSDRKNLLRFGQFLASTLSECDNENDEGGEGEDSLSLRRISLRNVMLELVLCLIYGEGGELDHSFADALQETLGFDWLLLFLQAHLHNSTVVRAARILITMLGSPPTLARFKEGLGSGGWLDGTDVILNKTTYVVAGFNVGSVADNKQKYEINREVCNIPGFLMLAKLLPKHGDIPDIYFLLIALLLGRPVTDVYAGVQFDWNHLPTPTPQEPGSFNIYCPEAALVLLTMTHSMVNEAWWETAEGSWVREYPVTLIEYLLFLHRNISSFSQVCTSIEFLDKLVAILFPKRKNMAKLQGLVSDSENEGELSPGAEVPQLSTRTLLITHPARKSVFKFLRVIMTDSLTSSASAKSQTVIDTILESFPSKCSQAVQAEYQTEVLCAQVDFFLGGNLLMNPSAGPGNHGKIVANAFSFASKVVDKLWIGNFVQGYKTVFNFLTSTIEAVKGQPVSLESVYHSLNRTILFQLSRPLARLTDQTSLLEFLHILTTNNKLVFAAVNNEPEFIAGLCHWLLVMGTHKSETVSDDKAEKSNNGPRVVVGSFDVAEEITEEADAGDVNREEEASCTNLLAIAAERVWNVFLENKREAIEDAFKIILPKPSFTSYSSRDYIEHMPMHMGSATNMNLDLKSVRPLIGDAAHRMWVAFIAAEERQKAEALGQQKPTPSSTRKASATLRMLTKSKKESKDHRTLIGQSHLWWLRHTRVVGDLVTLQHKNHLQNYQLISKSVAEEWALMDSDLTRERGLWGPPSSSQLDKWALDMVEGPHRMRKKMCRNDMFYLHYPYDAKAARKKPTKYRAAVSRDSKMHYELRGSVRQGLGPIEALTQPQVLAAEGEKVLTDRTISSEPSYVTEENEGSEVDNNQTIVKLLEAGEKIRSMFRCARIQALDTAEGLFLFGQEHFYVVDGVTLLSTKEIKDIDSLPQGTHDPIIPKTSHEKATSSTMKRMCSKWAYEDIREVHKRRYVLQETALEVFSSDGRNHFLVFPKPVRSKVYDKLVAKAPTLRENAEESVVGMKRDTDVEAGVGLINTLMGERSVTQRWERGEITNFQYLMHLNTLAGRSYNDLMQYPVFPWVLADYLSEELDLTNAKTFRDFSKPMGAQTEKRLLQFQKRYREWDDPTGETPPYHYGTHYSSAMIVASYLIRMEPFAQHFLRVQGGHFDLPDRLFSSVKDAWLSAAKTNMSDIKELIPEFFYLPEFLTNHNKFEFGTKQNGEALGDVILPVWAKGDPREFIRLHRKALECDFVSAHLHEWIDLIFGYKQQGPLATEANNVFHYYFYEGNVNIQHIDDPVKKNAAISFINNFGQIPKQLFKRPHPPKKVFRSVEPDAQTGILINVDRLFFHNLPSLVPSAQPVKAELKGPVGQMIQPDRGLLAVERNKVLVPPDNNRYFAWGFGDLSMRTGFYETDKITAVFENFHIGQVLCAACPDSRTLITGGTSTLVCVWDMVKSSGREKRHQIILHEVLYGHHASVTCLAVSTAYNLIVSGSEDHTCIIWDLSKLTYVRQLAQHMGPITAIAINDLTGDIATCAGTHLYVWSVNGLLIVKENTSLQNNNHIQCCAMSELSEWDEENVILTGSMDGVVRMWGIEFYDEAAKIRTVSKSQSPRKEEEPESSDKQSVQEESRDSGSQSSAADAQPVAPDSSPTTSVNVSSQSGETVGNSEQVEPRSDERTDEASQVTSIEDHVMVSAADDEASIEEIVNRYQNHMKTEQRVASLDEDYVIIHHKEKSEDVDSPKPVWKRRLVLRHKLTMHTAFAREDNIAPAAVTALLVSKDHRKLFVGDARGRIYSWSVTDAAGRMADHWVKDEFADLCSGCAVKFKFTERRHHCRDCGKVFCARCSSYESEITRLGIHSLVRVCHACYVKLKKSSRKSNS